MAVDETKACTKCGEVKPLFEFHKKKASYLGVTPHCKLCDYKRKRIYRAANLEKARASYRRYYSANREKVRALNNAAVKRYIKANPEKFRECVARYKKANPTQVRESTARYKSRATVALEDSYVYKALTRGVKIPREQITEQLIKLKREQLTVYRLARQLKEATHESSKDTDRITGEHGASSDAGRLASDRGEQPVGAGPQGDQRHGCGGDGEGAGLDQQQPER